jgi:hypothetical protein
MMIIYSAGQIQLSGALLISSMGYFLMIQGIFDLHKAQMA